MSTYRQYNATDPGETIVNKTYADETWVRTERPGLHSGVLTLPAYLLRFMTNRGRANRFSVDFLCYEFLPPAQPEDPASGCSPNDADLLKRCTCRGCHASLEPLAAHWGRFAESGTTMMTDATLFPRRLDRCIGASDAFCRSFYVTQPDAENAGALIPYQYEPAHPGLGLAENIEAGPRPLAERAIESGELARCTARKLFYVLMGRSIRADGEEQDEAALLDSLAQEFMASGYDFRKLVEKVVTLPQYGRND
jgi:hypothetical protein